MVGGSDKWAGGKHLLLARCMFCIWTFVKFFKRKILLAEPTVGSLEWILHERLSTKYYHEGELGLGKSMQAMDTTRAPIGQKCYYHKKERDSWIGQNSPEGAQMFHKVYIFAFGSKVDDLCSWHLDTYGLVILQSRAQITKVYWCAELGLLKAYPRP